MRVLRRLEKLERQIRALLKRATVAGGGFPASAHASRHENGGSDEINVAGLSGVLADPQTVSVDPAGALDGNGATGTPLAVRVDGVTIGINGSNELAAAPSSSYTDEQAQDAVGGILSDAGDIDFTYDDATPAISAILKTTSTPQVARLGIGAAADASAALKVVGQLWIPLVDDGNSGAAKTINWNDGNEHLLTLTDNVTLTLSNPADGGRYVLVLATGAGGFTPTFPASVHWPGGVTPTFTTAASKFELITLLWLAGAGIYLASINQNYSA